MIATTLTLLGTLAAAQPPATQPSPLLYTGCKKICVQVYIGVRAAGDKRLPSAGALEALLEGRLRSARLCDSDCRAMELRAWIDGGGVERFPDWGTRHVIDMGLRFNSSVLNPDLVLGFDREANRLVASPDWDPGQEFVGDRRWMGWATIWERSTVGVLGDTENPDAYATLSRHLDEFIRDYLRANEPSCPAG